MSSECPDTETLQRFANGIAVDNFDHVAEHIGGCPRCAAIIENHDSDDFVASFRKIATQQVATRHRCGDRIGPKDEILVIRKIGEGGLAEVWQAYQARLDRFVAVKFLRLATHPAVSNFISEAQVLAKLRHSNIVAVHDCIDVRGQPAIIMQLVNGSDLEHLLTAKDYDFKRLWCWANQLIDAIAYLHSQNVVHGDIKPSNLMINHENQLMVTDFGLASSDDHTRRHVLGGTPGYCAPEQANGNTSKRSDLFAIGKVFWDLADAANGLAGESTIHSTADRKQIAGFAKTLRRIAEPCTRESPDGRTLGLDQIARELENTRPRDQRSRFGWTAVSTVPFVVVCVIGLLAGVLLFSNPGQIFIGNRWRASASGSSAINQWTMAESIFDLLDDRGFVHLSSSPSIMHDRMSIDAMNRDQAIEIEGVTAELASSDQLDQLIALADQCCLEWLAIENGVFHFGHAERLAEINSIRQLYFVDVSLSDEVIIELCRSTSLSILGLWKTDLTNRSVDAIAGLPMLNTLELKHCKFDDQMLLRFGRSGSLKRIYCTSDHELSKAAIDRLSVQHDIEFEVLVEN